MDEGLRFEIAGGALQKDDFHGAQFRSGSGSLEDAFAEFVGKPAPEVGDVEILIVEFVAGQFEEWQSACGPERDADDAGLFVGVDSDGGSTRAAERDGAEGIALGGVVRIVQARLVLGEVDDQRHAAIGHKAFLCVRLRIVPVIPDLFDEGGERRAGSEKQAIHGVMIRPYCGGEKRERSTTV